MQSSSHVNRANTITPIIFRGHHLSTEKVKKPQRKEIPQSQKPKSTFALVDIDHDLKSF